MLFFSNIPKVHHRVRISLPCGTVILITVISVLCERNVLLQIVQWDWLASLKKTVLHVAGMLRLTNFLATVSVPRVYNISTTLLPSYTSKFNLLWNVNNILAEKVRPRFKFTRGPGQTCYTCILLSLSLLCAIGITKKCIVGLRMTYSWDNNSNSVNWRQAYLLNTSIFLYW